MIIRSVAAMLLVGMASAVCAQDLPEEHWNFGYTVTGAEAAKPRQVFDDASRTYFQFGRKRALPTVYDGVTGAVIELTPQGDLLTAPVLSSRFVFKLGGSEAAATNTSTTSPRGRVSVAEASGRPNATAGGFAVPLRGDTVRFVSKEPASEEVWFGAGDAKIDKASVKRLMARAMSGELDRVLVIARDDDSLKEGVVEARAINMRDELIAAGVPREIITVQFAGNELSPRKINGKMHYASHVRFVYTLSAPQASKERAAQGEKEAIRLQPAERQEQPVAAMAAVNNGAARPVQAVVADAKPAAPSKAFANQSAPQTATSNQRPSNTVAGNLVPAAIAPVPQPAKAPSGLLAPEGQTFAVTTSDKTVEGAVRRWAGLVGYQLVWDVNRSYAVTAEGDFGIEFFAGLAAISDALSNTDHPIRFCVHANNVVRAVNFTSSCDRMKKDA